MSTIKELRGMNTADLTSQLIQKRADLIELRRAHAANELSNPHKIADTRREIAKIATIINENRVQTPQEKA